MPLLVACNGSTEIACDSSRTCSSSGMVCDLARGVCVECAGDADCIGGDDQVCRANRCTTETPCRTSRECPGLVCDVDRGFCVECLRAADCDPGRSCVAHACVITTSDGGVGFDAGRRDAGMRSVDGGGRDAGPRRDAGGRDAGGRDAGGIVEVTNYWICDFLPGDCSGPDVCTMIDIPSEGTAGQMCTRSCGSDAACVPGKSGLAGRCYSLDGTTPVCYQGCATDYDCYIGNRCINVSVVPVGGVEMFDSICVPDNA